MTTVETTVETTAEVEQIGLTAGLVWSRLNTNGPTKMSELVKAIDAPRDLVMQAVGWLARERKIMITLHSRTRVVELVE